ncbi:hypothetical protein L9F63_010532, partial [Diploptera punctata]
LLSMDVFNIALITVVENKIYSLSELKSKMSNVTYLFFEILLLYFNHKEIEVEMLSYIFTVLVLLFSPGLAILRNPQSKPNRSLFFFFENKIDLVSIVCKNDIDDLFIPSCQIKLSHYANPMQRDLIFKFLISVPLNQFLY